MPLERGDVAVVGTNRVRRQILRGDEPANVLLTRVTDLHRATFRAGLGPAARSAVRHLAQAGGCGGAPTRWDEPAVRSVWRTAGCYSPDPTVDPRDAGADAQPHRARSRRIRLGMRVRHPIAVTFPAGERRRAHREEAAARRAASATSAAPAPQPRRRHELRGVSVRHPVRRSGSGSSITASRSTATAGSSSSRPRTDLRAARSSARPLSAPAAAPARSSRPSSPPSSARARPSATGRPRRSRSARSCG